ncbi:hypothetical protein [Clostridium sp. ZS2-4]|uniref:hypothetical protein n=1 Tax=Clostridium sp. ZS2-4 TaxID=2987703 RepID=UPI00227A6035|nr:hypothetical protein [Clostridium sp. ZS2-4]MCY6355099.1 hypothetical protein [Clostridium sp. ZS2-4]
MKIRTKIFGALAIAGCISLGAGISASAKMDAYLVKDKNTNMVYEYDSKTLIDGFLNYSETKSDPFYEDFISKVSKFGTYAYHDSTGKYVDFSIVSDAFLNASERGKPFSLMTFTETKEAISSTSIPKIVKKASVSGGKLVYTDKDTGTAGAEEPLEIISIE